MNLSLYPVSLTAVAGPGPSGEMIWFVLGVLVTFAVVLLCEGRMKRAGWRWSKE